jgi:hypothetical protein
MTPLKQYNSSTIEQRVRFISDVQEELKKDPKSLASLVGRKFGEKHSLEKVKNKINF